MAGFLAVASTLVATLPARAAEWLDSAQRERLVHSLEAYLNGIKHDLALPHGFLNWRQQIRNHAELYGIPDQLYYFPPGLEAYFEDNIKITRSTLNRLRSGQPVSSAAYEKFMEPPAHEGSGMVYDILRHAEIEQASKDPWIDDRGPFMARRFIKSPSGGWKQEIYEVPDVRAHLDRLAAWRMPKLQFAHRLGEVTIITRSRDERRNRLLDQITAQENQAESARRYLTSLDREISKEKLKLLTDAQYELDRLVPFETTMKEAAAAAGLKIPAVDSPSPAPTPTVFEPLPLPDLPAPAPLPKALSDERRLQIKRRIAELEKALDYLFAEENAKGASDFTRQRIDALDQERAELAEELRAADRSTGTPRTTSPAPNNSQALAAYEDAFALYRSEAFISRKTLDSLAISVEVKMEQKQRLLDEIVEHETRIAEIQKELDALGPAGVPPFSVIESAHAELRFDGTANSEMAALAVLIAEQAKRLRDSEQSYTEATRDIRLKSDAVFAASLRERNSTGASYVAQALTQAAIQIFDNYFLEAHANPHAFVAMAFSQMAANLTVSKPVFYDADIDRRTQEAFVKNMPGITGRAADAGKTVGTELARPLTEHGAMKALNGAMVAAARNPRLAEHAAVAAVRAQLAESIKATPKKASGFGVIKSVILDAATEELKAEMAKAMQLDSIRELIATEEALADALGRRTQMLVLRDADQAILDSLTAARARLRGGSVPIGPIQAAGIAIERNEPFDVEGGYIIMLDVTGEDKSILSEVEMQLAGYALRKGTAPGYFVVDEKVAASINDADLPEEISVIITVKGE